MPEPAHANGKLQRAEALRLRVEDVMVRRPKTLHADATVADLRELFRNPRVRTALLADGGRFAGAVAPEELPASADDEAPARDYARMDVPTVGPDAAMADAVALMERLRDPRLVVVDADGATLVGLLCLDKTGAGFCVDPPAPA